MFNNGVGVKTIDNLSAIYITEFTLQTNHKLMFYKEQ